MSKLDCGLRSKLRKGVSECGEDGNGGRGPFLEVEGVDGAEVEVIEHELGEGQLSLHLP
jgi:hypothetical protein